MTDIKIINKDFYGDNCLQDSLIDASVAPRSPQGFVELYEVDENDNEKLLSKSNLVVYSGREVIAQRLFNKSNALTSATENEFICWFGIGSGGTNVGDPLTPSPPVATDLDLAISAPISNIDPSCGDKRADGYWYKKPIDTIEFEQDVYNSNAWLIVKTVSRVSLADAIDQHISEAGLFTSEDGNLPDHPGPFHLFSKVTFPTVVKTSTRQLLFIWYIYF